MTFKADRLEPEVFRTMLRFGRGSALMHVLEYGLDGVEDMVLQACLCNQVYDQQSEDSRAPWLYRMFKNTPQYDRFSREILAAMEHTTEHWDLLQLCRLIAEMAIDGDINAASALREYVLTQEFSDQSDQYGCEDLVRLDGMPALAEIGRRFGAMLLVDADAYATDPKCLMDGFEDQPANLATLDQLAENDLALTKYVQYYRRGLASTRPSMTPAERKANQRERIRQQYSIDAILAAAAAGEGESPGRYQTFGRHATMEELDRVLRQLLTTIDARTCQRLLWVFNRTAMPRIDDRIWELAEHEDEELRDAAISALSNMRDTVVGQFGRRKLDESGLGAGDASLLGLFTNNFREGDAELILTHLEGLVLSDDEAHSFSYRVVDICEANDTPSIAGLAEWTYKSNPCSHCRRHAVERLLAVSRLSPAFAVECTFDADQDIRASAAFFIGI